LDSHPIRFLRNLGRSREIATVMINFGFEDLVIRLGLKKFLNLSKRVIFWKKPAPVEIRSRGKRIRLALEALGPTFIKFGQVISTRPDLVPADVIQELSLLQEKVPPFPSEEAVRLIEKELKMPCEKLFKDFEKEPLAAGSLGQVHRATHHDGTPLAIKIRRPNVVHNVERDLELMKELAILIDHHIPESHIFDPIGLVNNFCRTIRREMNYYREAKTCMEFAHLFQSDASLNVPEVYPDYSTESILTMEFIDGLNVNELDQDEKLKALKPEIAANGARIFMKMAFEFGIFHSDPHPGNIRILPDGSLAFLDFGMVGILEEQLRDQLIDMFLAITQNDVKRVVGKITEIGTPLEKIDFVVLQADVREFVGNYYGVPLERLQVGNVLTDFISILSHHGIRCPSDIMLLIRAMVTLEGVGRNLDPNYNLAKDLAPFIEKCVRDRYNPKKIANRVLVDSKALAKVIHDVPFQVGRTLEKLSKNELTVSIEHQKLDQLITEMDRSGNRIVISLIMSSLIVASALIMRAGSDNLWISLPVFGLSSFLGIWLIYGIFRSGRL
jgi:ubiquinone biosynthesis protein